MRTKQTVPVANKTVVRLRKQKGWTQQELADNAGVSLRTIQSIEAAGAEALPHATMQPIADALGVPRGKLLKVDEPLDTEIPKGLHRITVFINGVRHQIDETTELVRIIDALFTKESPDPVIVMALINGSLGIELLTTPLMIGYALLGFLHSRKDDEDDIYGALVSHLIISRDTPIPFIAVSLLLEERLSLRPVYSDNDEIIVYRSNPEVKVSKPSAG